MTNIPDKSATQDNPDRRSARRRKSEPSSIRAKGQTRSAPHTKTQKSAKPAKQSRGDEGSIRGSQDKARRAHAFGANGLVGTTFTPKLELPTMPAVGDVASGMAGWIHSGLDALGPGAGPPLDNPLFRSTAPSSETSDRPAASEESNSERTGDDFQARLQDQLKTSFKIEGYNVDVRVSVERRERKQRPKKLKTKKMSEKEAAELPPTERWRADPLTVKDLNISKSGNSEHVRAMAKFLQTNAHLFASEGKLKENLDRIASETGKPLFLDPLFALQPRGALDDIFMKSNFVQQWDHKGRITTASTSTESSLQHFEFQYYPDGTLEGFRRTLNVPGGTDESGNSEIWSQSMVVSIFHDKFKDDPRRRSPGPAHVAVQEVHDDGQQPVTVREEVYDLPTPK